MESLRFDQFQISATEPITTYGARLSRFLNQHLYWGGSAFGAMFGQRGGWFVGGFNAGLSGSFAENWIYDLWGFYGGGGGGAAPQGGGMMGKISLGIGYRFLPGFEGILDIGYNHYFNGAISSPVAGFELRSVFYEIQ
jgi:hypothetical protein